MRTFTEHIALQIAIALPRKKGTLFITGGGAYNDFLIERIQFHFDKIIIPENTILEFSVSLAPTCGQINVYRVMLELKQITVAGISTNQNNISNTQYLYVIKHIAMKDLL
jgi:hypothetical protein